MFQLRVPPRSSRRAGSACSAMPFRSSDCASATTDAHPALRPAIHARRASRSTAVTRSPAAASAIASPPMPQQMSEISAPAPSTSRMRCAFQRATESPDACSMPCTSHQSSAPRANFPDAPLPALRRASANSSAADTRSASNRLRSRATLAASRESTAAAATCASGDCASCSHTETSCQLGIGGTLTDRLTSPYFEGRTAPPSESAAAAPAKLNHAPAKHQRHLKSPDLRYWKSPQISSTDRPDAAW